MVPPLCSCHWPHPQWHPSSSYAASSTSHFLPALTFRPLPPSRRSRLFSSPHTLTHKTHNLYLPLPSPALHISLPHPPHHPSLPPSLNWESGRAVEIALTRALPGCAIHLLFYYAAPGLPGLCRSICHRPRSLITGICHRLASLLMLSSPPWQPPSAGERRRQSTSVKRIFPRLRGPHTAISHIKALMKGAGRVCVCVCACVCVYAPVPRVRIHITRTDARRSV